MPEVIGTPQRSDVQPTSMPSGLRAKWRNPLPRVAYYALCTLLLLAFTFPIFWLVVNSVKPPAEASAAPPTFLPTHLDWGNYEALANVGVGIWQYVYNSVTVAIGTVAGTIVLSVLAGYGFSRFAFRAKGLLFVAILVTLMIPFQSIVVPLFLVLHKIHLTNSLVGLTLVYITFQLPFSIFLMRNSFDAVPRELEEAALIDGCTAVNVLFHVFLAVVRPGIITVGLFAFFASWNEFFAALIFMTDQGKFTLPVMLTIVNAGNYGTINWGTQQSAMAITMLPCVVIFLLLQRYYVGGLLVGAVKG